MSTPSPSPSSSAHAAFFSSVPSSSVFASLECSLCFAPYDTLTHVPIALCAADTFCLACAQQLAAQATPLRCADCKYALMRASAAAHSATGGFQVNQAVRRIVEEREAAKKRKREEAEFKKVAMLHSTDSGGQHTCILTRTRMCSPQLIDVHAAVGTSVVLW